MSLDNLNIIILHLKVAENIPAKTTKAHFRSLPTCAQLFNSDTN